MKIIRLKLIFIVSEETIYGKSGEEIARRSLRPNGSDEFDERDDLLSVEELKDSEVDIHKPSSIWRRN